MDRLLAMQVFVRVVETGSFSKTAKEFFTTQPTITKMVSATEARLKVRLLNRNTRGVSATEAGALFYEKCKIISVEAEEAEHIAKKGLTDVHGLLRISTSVAFGRRVVVPLALEFMAHHPHIQVDLIFEDRYTDLVAQGIDVAIRMGKLADSSLGARFLGINPWLVGASNQYLQKHGTPTRPEDLNQHNALIYSSVQERDIWRLQPLNGDAIHIPVKGNWRSNNLSAVLAATLAHMGIAALPWYVAHEAVKSGKVIECLSGYKLPEQEIHAVYPAPKLISNKVQAFTSFLHGKFAGQWWGDLTTNRG